MTRDICRDFRTLSSTLNGRACRHVVVAICLATGFSVGGGLGAWESRVTRGRAARCLPPDCVYVESERSEGLRTMLMNVGDHAL